MSEMRKRVAQAICLRERGGAAASGQCKACRNANYEGDEYLNLGDGCLGFGYDYLADAAIAAMRAPTEAMIDAGYATDNGGESYNITPEFCWRGMIDAALAD